MKISELTNDYCNEISSDEIFIIKPKRHVRLSDIFDWIKIQVKVEGLTVEIKSDINNIYKKE